MDAQAAVSAGLVQGLRQAAEVWRNRPIDQRLAVITRFQSLLRRRVHRLPGLFPRRPATETLTAELLPLLAACTFLRREAPRVLATRHLGWRRRPIWLARIRSVVERRPFGAVLILAPGNYPLMLPGIQVLQALVAGNAVALKPAPGGEAAAELLRELLLTAQLPPELLQIVPVDHGPKAVAAGFDLIVLTGSAATGQAVLRQAAETLTPTIMELSGVDPVFVLPGADLGRVARALIYGARLNNGATCIAPHKVFVQHGLRDALSAQLRRRLFRARRLPAAAGRDVRVRQLAETIIAAGGTAEHVGDVWLFTGDQTIHPMLDVDLFSPWLAILGVDDMDEALKLDARSSYALGASVFGPAAAAHQLARRLAAGSICINDLIVPTADPRLPFGGASRSGFGATRGPEGLLALTRAIAISERMGG